MGLSRAIRVRCDDCNDGYGCLMSALLSEEDLRVGEGAGWSRASNGKIYCNLHPHNDGEPLKPEHLLEVGRE